MARYDDQMFDEMPKRDVADLEYYRIWFVITRSDPNTGGKVGRALKPFQNLSPSRREAMATLKEILTRRPVAATIRLTVPAGGARPAPPVGPALGQYRLNLMAFCKDFNARTQKYKPDTPMAVTITAFKDSTFEFTVRSPSVTWYLKKAAGIESGSSRPGHVVASTVTLRHIYEIAKVKQADPYCQYMSLESICKSIIGTANTMGIQVVRDL